MSNQINLTDNELEIIQTALHLSVLSYYKDKEQYGSFAVVPTDEEAIKGMMELNKRIKKEYS